MKISRDEGEADDVQELHLDKDEDMEETPSDVKPEGKSECRGLPASIVRPAVTFEEDPIEHDLQEAEPPSAELFKQRTEVFEQLMTFVNEGAKQPDKDLLKLINIDQGDF